MTEAPVADLMARFADPEEVIAVVPLTGESLSQVREGWAKAASAGADMVEWRLDWLRPKSDGSTLTQDDLSELVTEMRQHYQVPVLATYRTKSEGGVRGGGLIDDQELEYDALVRGLAKWADAVDVEYRNPSSADLIGLLKGTVPLVASFHMFTPGVDPMLFAPILVSMEEMGADVAKIAVMLQDPSEARYVNDAQEWAGEHLVIPSVILGMGLGGDETRLGDASRRSAFTFATVGRASAPGQPSLVELRDSVSN